MEPLFQKIGLEEVNHSFYVDTAKSQSFTLPLMFHPETEIKLVHQGSGKCLIGNSILSFEPGTLIMIGANVPHVWISEKNNNKTPLERSSILFRPEIFGEQFWDLPEAHSIKKLLDFSKNGIKLSGEICREVNSQISTLIKSSGFQRILLLFKILEMLASNIESQKLTMNAGPGAFTPNKSDRLEKIFMYITKNYFREITIDEIAQVANLTKSAFCHYFKKRTGRTFVEVLIEVRIGIACRFLLDEDHCISQVCYACGFNNISYFIYRFKQITDYTPLEYRKKFTL